jgi:hypothetical protein
LGIISYPQSCNQIQRQVMQASWLHAPDSH